MNDLKITRDGAWVGLISFWRASQNGEPILQIWYMQATSFLTNFCNSIGTNKWPARRFWLVILKLVLSNDFCNVLANSYWRSKCFKTTSIVSWKKNPNQKKERLWRLHVIELCIFVRFANLAPLWKGKKWNELDMKRLIQIFVLRARSDNESAKNMEPSKTSNQ